MTRIDKKANTIVIITFLEEDLPTVEINLIKEVEEKYRTLSKSYDFGETLDDDYGEDLLAI